MAANRAPHLVIISHDPVDLIVLAAPAISTDPATETALALVRRLLALTPETARHAGRNFLCQVSKNAMRVL